MLQASQVLQGRYQLQEKLGQNAGRQTWLATDLGASPSERVIVKLLAFSPQMEWEDFKLFEREAQVLKHLNNPQIPRYRDYFSLDRQTGSGLCWFALVQDCIPGKSLQQLLDEGRRFTEAQLRSLASQVLEILIYLHELNPPVLHRDIKPSNLILTEDSQIYLVDFGAVQARAATEGVTFTVVGTAGYAPLEQFWGRSVPASDLYSLGATLIHLLTGIAPADLPQKNLRIQFSDKVSINPNFIHWIEGLTAPDLEQRYSSAYQALEDLKVNRFLNSSLQKIRQPKGSRIKLWKSATKLKLEIPGRGLKFIKDAIAFSLKFILWVVAATSQLFTGSLIAVLMIGSLLALVAVISGFITAAFFINFSVPVVMLLAWLLSSVIQELVKVPYDAKLPRLSYLVNWCIYFDKSQFVIENKLFGWSYLRQTGDVSKIKNIQENILKGVSIRTEKKRYHFAQELTEAECKWLAQQIRDWLE